MPQMSTPGCHRARGDRDAHPVGAYFTDLPVDTPLLALKLRIPREKLRYVFAFVDAGDLRGLDGDRARCVAGRLHGDRGPSGSKANRPHSHRQEGTDMIGGVDIVVELPGVAPA